MEIILENNIQKLIPTDEDKFLVSKEDLEKEEEQRYYFKFAYIPNTMTLADCEEKYEEVEHKEEIIEGEE